MNAPGQKITIGRRDRVDFPDLGLEEIDAKIDSGAYSSAIHCHQVKLTGKPGARQVRFCLLDPSHPDYEQREFLLPVKRIKYVRSSTGIAEKRIFIVTNIRIFGRLLPLEMSLTDRSDMKYPVLLGRKLLKRGFVVDVTRFNLSFRQKKNNITNPKEIK